MDPQDVLDQIERVDQHIKRLDEREDIARAAHEKLDTFQRQRASLINQRASLVRLLKLVDPQARRKFLFAVLRVHRERASYPCYLGYATCFCAKHARRV